MYVYTLKNAIKFWKSSRLGYRSRNFFEGIFT